MQEDYKLPLSEGEIEDFDVKDLSGPLEDVLVPPPPPPKQTVDHIISIVRGSDTIYEFLRNHY